MCDGLASVESCRRAANESANPFIEDPFQTPAARSHWPMCVTTIPDSCRCQNPLDMGYGGRGLLIKDVTVSVRTPNHRAEFTSLCGSSQHESKRGEVWHFRMMWRCGRFSNWARRERISRRTLLDPSGWTRRRRSARGIVRYAAQGG